MRAFTKSLHFYCTTAFWTGCHLQPTSATCKPLRIVENPTRKQSKSAGDPTENHWEIPFEKLNSLCAESDLKPLILPQRQLSEGFPFRNGSSQKAFAFCNGIGSLSSQKPKCFRFRNGGRSFTFFFRRSIFSLFRKISNLLLPRWLSVIFLHRKPNDFGFRNGGTWNAFSSDEWTEFFP